MSASVWSVGNTGRSEAQVLAEKAARYIADVGLCAVCVDPRGRVSVEPVSSADDADLIGVYSPSRKGAWVELAALIERDLKTCPGVAKRRAA